MYNLLSTNDHISGHEYFRFNLLLTGKILYRPRKGAILAAVKLCIVGSLYVWCQRFERGTSITQVRWFILLIFLVSVCTPNHVDGHIILGDTTGPRDPIESCPYPHRRDAVKQYTPRNTGNKRRDTLDGELRPAVVRLLYTATSYETLPRFHISVEKETGAWRPLLLFV